MICRRGDRAASNPISTICSQPIMGETSPGSSFLEVDRASLGADDPLGQRPKTGYSSTWGWWRNLSGDWWGRSCLSDQSSLRDPASSAFSPRGFSAGFRSNPASSASPFWSFGSRSWAGSPSGSPHRPATPDPGVRFHGDKGSGGDDIGIGLDGLHDEAVKPLAVGQFHLADDIVFAIDGVGLRDTFKFSQPCHYRPHFSRCYLKKHISYQSVLLPSILFSARAEVRAGSKYIPTISSPRFSLTQ